MNHSATRDLLIWVWALVLLCGVASAQPRRQGANPDFRGLIDTLEDENEFVVREASEKLIRIGPRVIAPLSERLQREKNCDFQFHAAEVIRRIDPGRPIVKSTLIDVARGNCELSPGMHAALVNMVATSVLIEQLKGGIPLVARWLGEDDRSLRGSAAIAFDGLAELIERKGLPRARTKEIIAASKAAIPMLAKALDDDYQIVRCRSYAALHRMQRSSYKDLSAEATRALREVTDRCIK